MLRITGLVILLLAQVVFGRVPLLKPQYLGKSRIVGGNNAQPGQFPYQVSIRKQLNQHFCGASVVNANWVLSAAHCTINSSPSDWIIVVGTHLVSSGGYAFDCLEIINHPDFKTNDNPDDNDVSVMRTGAPMTLGGAIQAIPLINREVLQGTLIVSGWGQLTPTGGIPDNLQYLETNVVSREECGRIIRLNPDTFCAVNSADRGICFGDSGGPLVVPGEGQVGINSFVIGTCATGYPDGFCSVFYHRSWIINNTT